MIAEKDLEASRWLYNKKLYPQSIFYLEQAVEKAVKSLAIYTNIVTEREVKADIGHDAWKFFYKICIKVREKIEWFQETLNKFSALKKINFLERLSIQADELKGKSINCEKFFREKAYLSLSSSEEGLQSTVLAINELRRISFKIKEIDLIIETNEIEKFKRDLLEFLGLHKILNPELIKEIDEIVTKEFVLEMLKKLLEYSSNIVLCYMPLLFLSAIFSPYAVNTRYPDKGFNPVDVFTENHPLVKMLPSLIEITNETLERIKFMLKAE